MQTAARGIHRRMPVEITDSLTKRFWAAVDKAGPDDCWNWTRSFRNGYGAIKHQGRVYSAHRIAYIIEHGEPDETLLVTHKCDNRACCNPGHLKAGTAADNNREAADRGQARPNGEQCSNAKLDESMVMKVWSHRRTGLGARRIAKLLDLNENNVSRIIQKETWKHLIPNWAK